MRKLKDSLGVVTSIGDLGCGCGYSTAALKMEFPGAIVCGTQVPGPQFNIASEIGSKFAFSVVEKLANHVDLVLRLSILSTGSDRLNTWRRF